MEQGDSSYSIYDCFFSDLKKNAFTLGLKEIAKTIKLNKCTFINFHISQDEEIGAVYFKAENDISCSFIRGENLYCDFERKNAGIFGKFDSKNLVSLEFTSISSSGKSNINNDGINYFYSKQIDHSNANITDITNNYISLHTAFRRIGNEKSQLKYCNLCNLDSNQSMIQSDFFHYFQNTNIINNTSPIVVLLNNQCRFEKCNLIAPEDMSLNSVVNDDTHIKDCYINDAFKNKLNRKINMYTLNSYYPIKFTPFEPDQFKTEPAKTPHETPFQTDDITNYTKETTPHETPHFTPDITPSIDIETSPNQNGRVKTESINIPYLAVNRNRLYSRR